MKLGDFLNQLAKQSGISETDQDLISLLSNAGISTANISDGFATKIQNGLLTTEAAKNDPDLKRYFTALALNALDSELTNLQTEFELPDDVKTELTAEKSSYKRAAMLARKVKELEAKKIGANNKDKDKLAEQIDTLNQELATVKTNFVKEKSDLLNAHKADRVNWELNNHYSGYNYATQLSKEANIKLAQSLVSDEMTKAGVIMELSDTGELKLKTKEGTEYYVNNKPVGIKDFLDKALTTHKVIAIDDKTNQNQQQNQNQNQNFNFQNQNQNQNQGKKSAALAAIEAELNAELANNQQ